MSSLVENKTVQENIKRLIRVCEEVIDALRAQRDVLKQRGMGLPPGTLSGLKDIQQDLERLTDLLASDSTELDHLRALAETTKLVNSSLNLNSVLTAVMDTVIGLTGAERGYIVLRDEHTGQMEFRIARNLDRETIDEGSFIVSRTIVNQVAETGQPVLTTDALSDPNYSAQESIVVHALRSILCVPLSVRDQITGAVYVDNRIKNALFGEKQLALLLDFANQAAIAIENARLFERVQSSLAEVTEMKELRENVFASIASGVITADMRDVVTTYNTAAERILNMPYQDVLGQPFAETLPVIYDHVRDLLDAVYEHGAQEMIEIDPVVPERGEVNLNLKLTPLRNQDTTEGVAIVVDDLTEIKRRDATLNVVRRYLPPTMLDHIESIDGLGLGGERRTITTVFVETRPFSSFPPHTRPSELMEMLNVYLTIGAEAIHNQRGVIDKFMGNEIMGLFNTQLNPSDDHAWWAVQAVLKIADEYTALSAQTGGTPMPYYRIGIHTGVATLGNVGSATRREFTAIGDSVNLTKRLQESAAPGQIIITEETHHHCANLLHDPAHRILVLERGTVQVRGRQQPVKVYEIQRR
jgi:PAS domain S-box-containing protein